MTVFYDADRLWDVVFELLSHGFTIDQYCCAGRADRLTVVPPPSRLPFELSSRLWDLVRCVEPYSTADGASEVVATSGAVLQTLAYACPARAAGLPAVKTSARKVDCSCSPFQEHIDRGAVLLVVEAGTPSQQAKSSHLLLRYSPHSIQTFEFTTGLH